MLLFLILRAIFLGFVDHTLDIILAQTSLIVGDVDLVFLVGRLLQSGDIQDTISIYIKSDLNLRNPTRSGGIPANSN
jgi:hypothetical protein